MMEIKFKVLVVFFGFWEVRFDWGNVCGSFRLEKLFKFLWLEFIGVRFELGFVILRMRFFLLLCIGWV